MIGTFHENVLQFYAFYKYHQSINICNCLPAQILPDLLAFQESDVAKEDSATMLVSVPTCFYTQYAPAISPSQGSPEPPESILVLEDMRSLGYKVCTIVLEFPDSLITQSFFQGANFTSGLTVSQTEAAIRAIVAIHALSLGLKLKKKVDVNEKYPVGSTHNFVSSLS